MMKVLKEVLSKEAKLEQTSSSYVDDILVEGFVTSAEEIMDHLRRFGLATKLIKAIEGARAQTQKRKRDLNWNMNMRELFSMCGKLVCHCYVVAG